jgi:two-component system sensor histidine kinase PilS (NtrC family)
MEREHFAERIRWVAGARMTILLLLTATTLAAFEKSAWSPSPRTLLATAGLVVFLNALALMPGRNLRHLKALAALALVGDLLFCTVVLYLTGGAESTFSVLYHLIVIVGAFVFGVTGATVTGLASVLCYCVVAMGLHLGWLEGPNDVIHYSLSPREVAYYVAINVGGLTLVAALAGHLADRERLVGGKLAEAQRATADLAALNDDIVRSLTVGLAATDHEGTILWMNPAGREILDGPTSQFVGQSLPKLFALPDEEDARAESGGDTRYETPDHRCLILSYRRVPLVDGVGERRGELLVFQDNTEFRNMQLQVQRAESLAVLGRLAAGMAHELRNPLGSVSGSLEMLQESAQLDDTEQHLVGIMLRELNRLNDLVTQMLDLARPRAPAPRDVDLAWLTRDVVQALAVAPEARDLQFKVDFADALLISADPDQMRQLLWNLLRNASQAAPTESEVLVSGRWRDRWVRLEISDSGAGVDLGEEEKIFDPFFSTKRGGVGMGLAICRQVVEAHGGDLSVKRRDEGGTTFRIDLPSAPGMDPSPSPLPLTQTRRRPSDPFLP